MKDLFGEPRRRRWRTWVLYSLGFVTLVAGGYALTHRVIDQPWSARRNVGSEVIGDQIYIVGGQSYSTSTLLDEVLRIDPERSRMEFVLHLPFTCYSPATAVSEEHLYILGGYDGRSYRDDVLRVDDKQAQVAARLPTPRAYGGAVGWEDTLYYAGGTDGKRLLDEIVAVDLSTGQTAIVGRLSSPRQYVAAETVGGYVYFIGGEGADAAFSDEIVEFDPSVQRITRIGRLPSPRYLVSVVPWDAGLLVLAGKNVRFLDEVVSVDVRGEAIHATVIDHLPDLSWHLSVQPLGDRIYIIGGSNPQFRRAIRLLAYVPGNDELEPVDLRGHVWK